LISRAHFLIRVSDPTVWVGFDEYGRYTGTEPYVSDARERDYVVSLAQEKATRIFRHVSTSGDT
jgi:hypothetical protein